MMKTTRTLVLGGLLALTLSAGMAHAQNLTPGDASVDNWDHASSASQVQREQSRRSDSGPATFGHQRHPDNSVAR